MHSQTFVWSPKKKELEGAYKNSSFLESLAVAIKKKKEKVKVRHYKCKHVVEVKK